jgi:hypothetical protein
MQEILEYFLENKPKEADVSAELIARKTPGFTGAQLANMVNEAALAAAKEGASFITSALLDEARDKVTMGRERSLTRTKVRLVCVRVCERCLTCHLTLPLAWHGAMPTEALVPWRKGCNAARERAHCGCHR